MKSFKEYYSEPPPQNALIRAKGLAAELGDALKQLDGQEFPDRVSHFITRINQQSEALNHNISSLVDRINSGN